MMPMDFLQSSMLFRQDSILKRLHSRILTAIESSWIRLVSHLTGAVRYALVTQFTTNGHNGLSKRCITATMMRT